VWGIIVGAEQGSWVWLHFSTRLYPFPDFAVDMEESFDGNFYFSLENVKKIYVDHCIEVYGYIENEPNTYNEKTVDQPVIHVTRQDQLKFCDSLLR